MAKRVYSEQETAAILRRVAELQQQREDHSNTAGLTLGELEAIARDSGLDPSLLRQAAAEVDLNGTAGTSSSATTKTHIHNERTFSHRVSDEAWAELVFYLNDRFRSDVSTAMGMPSNRVEEIGDSYEWKHTSLSGIETRVTLRRRSDHTHLKLSQRLGMASSEVEAGGLGFFFGLFISVVAAAAASSVIIGIVSLLVAMMVLVPSIYIADKKWREKKGRQLGKIAEDAERIFNSFALHEESTSQHQARHNPESHTVESSPQTRDTPDLLRDSDAYTGAPSASDSNTNKTRQGQ